MGDEVLREPGVERCEHGDVCEHACRMWCRAYKPMVDRDALLALAKVLGGMGDRYNEHERYELGTTFKAIADRIREACGVYDHAC